MPWSQDQCKCGAQEQDDCCCCPTCFTPQGDVSIPANGCEDPHGCGLNRRMDPSIRAKVPRSNGEEWLDQEAPEPEICDQYWSPNYED
jgi:hypothetical protein